jgi:hypothetical protein
MSTLANHYQTIPSQYRGDPKAGLIGPVRLLKESTDHSIETQKIKNNRSTTIKRTLTKP